MGIDIYAANENDSLSDVEQDLYDLIMAYRAEEGLPSIPLSTSLTTTAGRHAADTYYNIWVDGAELPPGANLHSWSDAPYLPDHSLAENMWEAPQRIGTEYPTAGYEISAAGYSSIEAALDGWKDSPGHNAVIVNSGIWASSDWSAIGVGVIQMPQAGVPFGGNIYHVWFGTSTDPAGEPSGPVDPNAPVDLIGDDSANVLVGNAGDDRLVGHAGDDELNGGLGADLLNGGPGDDVLIGGPATDDRRDQIFGGDGNDSIDAGAGNDLVYGQNGNDTIAGGFGADELFGQNGDDVITGSAFSDLVFGGDGDDFVNGGFGFDRINGGTGADKFFHAAAAGHGSDWLQDYSAAEGDVLVFGGSGASASDFVVRFAHTATPEGERSGNDDIAEAFVNYRGETLWALVDGAGQDQINLQIGSDVFDLLI